MKKFFLTHFEPIIVFLVSFILYILLLPPGITFEDAGYFLATSLEKGYAHPPGYPLYTLLLKVWASIGLIFYENAAFIGSLFSAFLSSLGLALLYVFLDSYSPKAQHLTQNMRRLTLIGTCLLMALSFEMMEQSVLIEVYALHFILLVLLFISLQKQNYLWTGLFTGLALSNHSTAIYFFAFVLLWLILINNLNIKIIIQDGVKKYIPGVALGLLPYLYLPLVANPLSPLQWGSANSWAGFKEIVFRTNYWKVPASELSLQVKQLSVAFKHFFDQWGPLVPILFILSFACYYFIKNKKTLLFWHLCWFIQLPIMALLANMSVEAEGQKLVSVFFIPSYLFALIAIVTAFFKVTEKFKLKPNHLNLTLGLFLISIPIAAINNFSRSNMSAYNTPQLFVEQTQQMVEADKSIIFTWNDFAFTPLIYEKYVNHKFKNMTPIPHTFFKDLSMIVKYEKMYQLNLGALKEANLKFLRSRPPGYIGTMNDKEFYQALALTIKQLLNNGYRVFTEYKLSNISGNNLFFDPKGSFFEVLNNKPLLETEFYFLNQEKPKTNFANQDLWHKQFNAKYSEHLILKALLYKSSKHKVKLLRGAKAYATGTDAEIKVLSGISKHFPDIKL